MTDQTCEETRLLSISPIIPIILSIPCPVTADSVRSASLPWMSAWLTAIPSSGCQSSWTISPSREDGYADQLFCAIQCAVYQSSQQHPRIPANLPYQDVTGNPFRSNLSSITSLVVPSRSDTIATSLWANLFRRLDFPAFGGPMIATSNPILIRSADENPANSRCCSASRSSAIASKTRLGTSSGTSSSAKSTLTSTKAPASIRSCRHSNAFWASSPLAVRKN